ncbi:DNAH [Acanthosepion pharaonis]|uniref:DNAH n=1 Tax=Acanthosepion pharaonis TaxID=158019 RepID=A0A812BS88_ACAPH|nr:DNAH [Sepia pharaonis]
MLPRNDLLVKQQKSVKNGQYLYPAIKQRGYYSDIVSFGESHKLQETSHGPSHMVQSISWNIPKEKYTPSVNIFDTSHESLMQKFVTEIQGPTTELTAVSDFPWKASEPKVQLPYYTSPGECPRKIEIERLWDLFYVDQLRKFLLSDSNLSISLIWGGWT